MSKIHHKSQNIRYFLNFSIETKENFCVPALKYKSIESAKLFRNKKTKNGKV